MTNYSSAHTRFGLGGEYFWKDFSLRNNWYMSGTGTKSITIGGTDYYERVVPGWDVEVGYRLPFYPSLAFYLKDLIGTIGIEMITAACRVQSPGRLRLISD